MRRGDRSRRFVYLELLSAFSTTKSGDWRTGINMLFRYDATAPPCLEISYSFEHLSVSEVCSLRKMQFLFEAAQAENSQIPRVEPNRK